MSQTITITLTIAGADTGPFDLYSNADGYTIPFQTGISKASLVAGYTSTMVPNSATIIRVKSNSSCTNYIDLTITGVTTTTTSTSSSTSTTTTTQVGLLIVYARDIGVGGNASPTLQYTVNGGPLITLATVVNPTCAAISLIGGLFAGDVIVFTSPQTYSLGGSNSANSCPAPSGGSAYVYLVGVTGLNNVSLTFNRDVIV